MRKCDIDLKLLADCPNLQTIRFFDVDDNIIRQLPECCNNISALGLSGSYSAVGLNSCIVRCPNLESIYLKDCSSILNNISRLPQSYPNILKNYN